MKTSAYLTFVELEDGSYLTFSFRSGSLTKISPDLYRLLKNQEFSLIPQNLLDSLKEQFILVEKDEIHDLERECSLNKLKIVILPTQDCQLRCVYCGESKCSAMMTSKTQLSIIQMVQRMLAARKYETLEVDWFGGEPLLAIPIIKHLSKSFISMANENGVKYESKAVTNGLLLNRKNCRVLVEECQIKTFEVTLDGYKDESRRVTKTGNGVYDIVVKNLLDIRDFECTVNIRANVDAENMELIIPMLEDLKRCNLHHKVNFYIACIHSWGSENGKRALPPDEFADFQMQVFKWMITNDFKLPWESILPHQQKVHTCMMHGHPEANVVVDVEGMLYRCSEVPYTEAAAATKVGDVRTGIVYKENQFPYSEKQIDQCRTCPVYPVCGGSCPKRTAEKGYPECAIIKYNMNERVKFAYKYMLKDK